MAPARISPYAVLAGDRRPLVVKHEKITPGILWSFPYRVRLLRITAFIRWPWPSFAGSSLGHGFLFLPAVHVHHSVVRHLVAAWQEEQSALRAPNYQLGLMRHRLEKRGERREAKGVENRGFISRRINNTCRRCIILQWRRHSQINCYPGVVCQQVDQRAARCRGALRRQRVKIVYV